MAANANVVSRASRLQEESDEGVDSGIGQERDKRPNVVYALPPPEDQKLMAKAKAEISKNEANM